MTLAPAGPTGRREGLDLLDRALAYTRGTLASVRDADLDAPTPCRDWRLGDLLTHMQDTLDAFGEGARGRIDVEPRRLAARPRIAALQASACALLGDWSATVPDVVDVGGLLVEVAVVTHAAALEIAVHGWDVARATGLDVPVPTALARRLLPVAAAFVTEADRGVRFAPARPIGPDEDASERLLAALGRASSACRPT